MYDMFPLCTDHLIAMVVSDVSVKESEPSFIKFDVADTSGKVEVTLWGDTARKYKGKFEKRDVIRMDNLKLTINPIVGDNRWQLGALTATDFKLKKGIRSFN